MRVCRGVYMRPIETRFGLRAPTVEMAIDSLSALWGETIVPCGGAAANSLGLTLQIPVQPVYLTSGPVAGCTSTDCSSGYAMPRVGNWRHRTAAPAISFVPWPGSARTKSRTG